MWPTTSLFPRWHSTRQRRGNEPLVSVSVLFEELWKNSILLGDGFTRCLCIQRHAWLDSGYMFVRQFMEALLNFTFFYVVMDWTLDPEVDARRLRSTGFFYTLFLRPCRIQQSLVR